MNGVGAQRAVPLLSSCYPFAILSAAKNLVPLRTESGDSSSSREIGTPQNDITKRSLLKDLP
jgi:hypothetical protein